MDVEQGLGVFRVLYKRFKYSAGQMKKFQVTPVAPKFLFVATMKSKKTHTHSWFICRTYFTCTKCILPT